MDEIFDAATRARLGDIADVVWGRDGPMPLPEFTTALAEADAVVFGTWHYGRTTIRSAGPRLKAVLEVAGGHHHPDLDYDYLFDRGIVVGGAAPAFGPVVAEHALALTLAVLRRVAESDRGFREGDERYLHAGTVGASSLYHKRVGFVGCGGLARALRPLLAPFGVAVLGYDPVLTAGDMERLGVQPASLHDIFEECSVVYVLAASTASNRGLVDRTLMERLSPTDALILVSRAHLVDFDALTDLVSRGRFGAGIDVFPAEPVAADHPIRSAEEAVLTAHIAGALPEALLEIGRMVVDDLEALFAGRAPKRMQYATPALRRTLLEA